MSKIFLFQVIQFTQTIQFSIRMLLVLFNPQIGPYQSATTPGQSGPGSDGNEGLLRISQSSCTAGTSPSDCLVSYPGRLQRSSRCILQPAEAVEYTDWASKRRKTKKLFFSSFQWNRSYLFTVDMVSKNLLYWITGTTID